MKARVSSLVSAATLCGLSFVTFSIAVRDNEFVHDDRRVDRKLAKVRHSRTRAARSALKAARIVEPIGKLYGHGPFTLLACAWLLAHRHRAAAASIAAASLIAAVGEKVFDALIFFRAPPPSNPRRSKPSYPSGHALNSGAAAWTAAYILAREGALPALALSIVPMLAGGSKLLRGRHWTSDIAGGMLAAATLSCACAAAYEAAR